MESEVFLGSVFGVRVKTLGKNKGFYSDHKFITFSFVAREQRVKVSIVNDKNYLLCGTLFINANDSKIDNTSLTLMDLSFTPKTASKPM